MKIKTLRAIAALLAVLLFIESPQSLDFFIHATAQQAPVTPPSDTPGQLAANLAALRSAAAELKVKLAAGASVDSEVAQISAKKAELAQIKSDFNTLMSQQSGSSAKISGYSAAVNAKFDEVTARIDALLAAPTVANADALISYIDATTYKPDFAAINVQKLPHRILACLDAPKIGMAVEPPAPADLAEAPPEVEFTPEISALSAQLGGNPAKVFEFVANNVRYQPYSGSLKGARGTLAERAGNDMDIASLTVALLRKSGIPSKFVRGKIRVNASDLMKLLDVDNENAAVAILNNQKIPNTPIISGGRIAEVEITHTWVRAWVNHSPYRGATGGAFDRFVDLDPAFGRVSIAKFEDVSKQIGFDQLAFLDAIRKGTTSDTLSAKNLPAAFMFSTLSDFGEKVRTYLNASSLTPQTAYRKNSAVVQERGQLPLTPYYKVNAGQLFEVFSAIPDGEKHSVLINVVNPDGSTAFTKLLTCAEIHGKRITISYKGATAADEQIIADNALAVDFPAFQVDVVPVLKIDGVDAAVSATPVKMGLAHGLEITVSGPGVASSGFVKTLTAGEYYAVAFNFGNISDKMLAARKTALESAQSRLAGGSATLDETLGEILYSTAVNYLFQSVTLHNIAAGAVNVASSEGISVAIAGYGVTVKTFFDLPFQTRASHVAIDVPREITNAMSRNNDRGDEKRFAFLAGATSNGVESSSLSSVFPADSISTVRAFLLANQAGKKFFRVTKNNAAAVLPLLSFPPQVEEEFASIAAAGLEVFTPDSPVVFAGQNITAYIIFDPLLFSNAFVVKFQKTVNGGLLFTAALTQGQLMKLVSPGAYSSILSNAVPWFKAILNAVDEAGLQYIPAISAINKWFLAGDLQVVDFVAACILLSAPIHLVATQPGIFNVSASPEFISPNGDGIQDTIEITATVTRGASWTVKIFSVSNVTTPLKTFAGSTDSVAVSFGDPVPDGKYLFKIEAVKDGVAAQPRIGLFTVDKLPPTAAVASPVAGATLSLNKDLRGTAADANFKS